MPDNTITLMLEGDVSLDQFADAMRHLTNLVKSLATEVADDTRIDWEIESLASGSAIATIIGFSTDDSAVLRVVEGYSRVGEALERNREIPFSSQVRREATKITQVIRDGVTAVHFSTENADNIIYGAFEASKSNKPNTTVALGTVRGKAQTISERNNLKFVLYDTLFDQAVQCYVSEDQRQLIHNIWGKEVNVTGLVTRATAHGRPTAIRKIISIDVIPQITKDGYRRLRGLWQWNGEPAETTLRRLRDAEK